MLHIYVGSALLVLLRWAHARASERGTGNGKTPTYSFLYHRRSEGAVRAKHQAMKPLGVLIKEELAAQERTVSWFARKLHIDRSNAYRLFQKNSIDTALLFRISIILDRDFFALLSASLSDRMQKSEQL